MAAWDTVVIGGGLVGAALAWGLARAGVRVAVLDEGDLAFRASRGNFGLVWVQSKGDGMPDYAVWTRRSADIWPDLAAALAEETGIDTGYSKPGGLHFFFSDAEMDERRHLLARMHNLPGIADYGAKLIDRQEVLELAPDIGPDVLGASWSPHDGHVNPLRLLRALHAGMAGRGARYLSGHRVRRITPAGSGFTIETEGGTLSAGQVVLAAGLGNRALGPQVGLEVPVTPLKGQILVSERTTPFLTMPTHVIRQTDEGTVMMGDSHEDVGFETGSSSPVMADIARHAIRTFPRLAGLGIVRAWAALRIMTPDGYPLYQQSQAHPGAFSINCHSGVTLAGAHALALAPMLASGRLGAPVAAFSGERFHARQA
jgi:glycine/D-amino acid oxidase-like deaminating enzyme